MYPWIAAWSFCSKSKLQEGRRNVKTEGLGRVFAEWDVKGDIERLNQSRFLGSGQKTHRTISRVHMKSYLGRGELTDWGLPLPSAKFEGSTPPCCTCPFSLLHSAHFLFFFGSNSGAFVSFVLPLGWWQVTAWRNRLLLPAPSQEWNWEPEAASKAGQGGEGSIRNGNSELSASLISHFKRIW